MTSGAPFTSEEISRDIQRLGVRTGAAIMVHASLCAIGPVERGAHGGLATKLIENAPWDDYFGPGSPLDHLCQTSGGVLRLGADADTTTLLHWAEYVAPLPSKRRVRRHRRVLGPDGPVVRNIDCLDDNNGIVDFARRDYFRVILEDYLSDGRGRSGLVGRAHSQLIDAQDFVDFGVQWMMRSFGPSGSREA